MGQRPSVKRHWRDRKSVHFGLCPIEIRAPNLTRFWFKPNKTLGNPIVTGGTSCYSWLYFSISPPPEFHGAPMDDRWLSVEEISEYLGVSKDTIYTWIDAKGIPAHRLGRLWKFKKDEVDAWVKSGGASDRQGGSDEAQR
jgi:excisionase family DNA binding protein